MEQLKKALTDPVAITLAVFIAMAVLPQPAMYYYGKWHCYWFAKAPICQ